MTTENLRNIADNLVVIIIAGLLVATSYLFQSHLELSLADEGYLWYGAQRTLLGEVPIRDFMSYDPGRYYWSALFMNFWGDNGIIALRFGIACFQFIGLATALFLLAPNTKLSIQTVAWLIIAGLVILLWMNPRHKIFDCSLSIILVASLAGMLKNLNHRSCLFGGIILGLVAFFGRNHGVYGLIGTILVFVWTSFGPQVKIKELLKFILIWLGGIFIGYSPMLFLILFTPDFLSSFIDSIKFLFEFGATNLPLPVPWPWKASFELAMFPSILVGLFFVVILTFALLPVPLFIQRWRQKTPPISYKLLACAFMAGPYAHYAFSRADFSHLCQGIQPLLIAIMLILSYLVGVKKLAASLIILLITLITTLPHQPISKCSGSKCQEINVLGDSIKVPIKTTAIISLLSELERKHGSPTQPFMVAPFWPGAYAIFNKKSPMLNIYPILPISAATQSRETERLISANISFSVISDFPLDGRDSLRFQNTYPLIRDYLRANFVQVDSPIDKSLTIFVRKQINE
jgi:hypothetical protein